MSLAIETRLASARTRRMLEDTAITAAGGGVLTRLTESELQPGVWLAEVRCPDADRLELELDTVLQTVVLTPARALSHAA